jgi:hypothetical protein
VPPADGVREVGGLPSAAPSPRCGGALEGMPDFSVLYGRAIIYRRQKILLNKITRNPKMESRLTPTEFKRGRYRLFKCACGKKKWIFESNVKSGASKSCGCYNREMIQKKNRINLKGKTFGLLMVLDEFLAKKGNTYWKCRCKCGKERWVHYGALVEGRSKSCGSCEFRLKPPKNNLKGKRQGRLFITGNWRRPKKPPVIEWECECDCGRKGIWLPTARLRGLVKSCGCLTKESAAKTQHTLAKHKIKLSKKERRNLIEQVKKAKKRSRLFNKNMIVLLSDRNRPGGSLDDKQISKRLKISSSLVGNVRVRFAVPEYQSKINKSRRDKWSREPAFKLKHIIHHQIKQGLKRLLKRKRKGVKTKYNKYLGCSIDDLKLYLERRFEDGMTWENHTNDEGIKGWHIHHIRPRASFNLSREVELKECFNFKNLTPKWGQENVMESSFWEGRYWRNGKPFNAKRTLKTIRLNQNRNVEMK